jgi:phage replication O-like protein O
MDNGYTKVPNIILDTHLKQLSLAELKLLLIIVRQTMGWRKQRDRISHGQFIKKSGLSRKVLSKTIQSLVASELIAVHDFNGNPLRTPEQRKGKLYLYYSFLFPKPVQVTTATNAVKAIEHVHSATHNKRNLEKENLTKGKTMKSIGELLKRLRSKFEQ